jgi:hypothetical protein
MQVDPAEFRALDLRCHSLLADVPIHDVWGIPLSGGGSERTIEDALAVSPLRRGPSPNVVVRGLFAIRRTAGQLLGWDDSRHVSADASYVHRLTDDDRARSSVRPGTAEGAFRLLYVFPHEAVAEIRNATVHAFLVLALSSRPDGHMLYWAIYVKPVGALTGLYMALIDPFRRWIVYPALIAEMQDAWARAYA